jgi:8-oxo-dGTP pyrophosphatase MutT (NUDIX family)
MSVKECVGGIIYFDPREIFLMTSKKWGNGEIWLVPGGRIEQQDKSKKDAFRREIREELGIELADIVYAGESIKQPNKDFYIPDTEFHFISYYARALSKNVKPNDEILRWNWFDIEIANCLPLLDSTRNLLVDYVRHLIIK